MSGLKLGIVRLGRCAGKMKYSLVDEKDIALAESYVFEAKLEVDRNGCGTRIVAWAYDVMLGRSSGRYLHDILWERYRGYIPEGHQVVHHNGVAVDNRLQNLGLRRLRPPPRPLAAPHLANNGTSLAPQPKEEEAAAEAAAVSGAVGKDGLGGGGVGGGVDSQDLQPSIYSVAMLQLPPDNPDDAQLHPNSVLMRYIDPNGDIIHEEEEVCLYYECRWAGCTALEREPREFSMCGRCQQARYCGTACQQRDWPAHKRHCKERQRPQVSRHRPYPSTGGAAHLHALRQGLGPER